MSNDCLIEHKLDAVLAGIQRLETQGANLMAALDDLNTAVANVQSAVNTAVTLIQSLHQNPAGTVTDAEVEAAVTALNAAATALGGAMPQP